MKKTVKANISGIVLTIDEDAYSILNSYIERIRAHFAKYTDHAEIVADIESRIAEMLSSRRIMAKGDSITLEDINEVIATMGEPEQFGIEDEGEDVSPKEASQTNGRRRLFRDPDNKIAGGVCGGIAAYFDVDPIWFRLFFILTTFFPGFGVLVYLVLWMAVPIARTMADRLEMRGKKVTISNMEKTFKEELGHLKTKMKDFEKEAKSFWCEKKKGSYVGNSNRFFGFITEIIRASLKFVLIFIAFVLFLVALVAVGSLIGFYSLSGVMFVDLFNINSSVLAREILPFITGSFEESVLFVTGIFIVVIIPVIMLIFYSIRMLFKFKKRSRVFPFISILTWFIGVAIVAGSVVSIIDGFSDSYVKVDTMMLPIDESDGLFVDVSYSCFDLDENDVFRYNSSRWKIINDYGYNEIVGVPNISLVRGDQINGYRVDIIKHSRGSSKYDAKHRSEMIEYNFELSDTVLYLDDCFRINEENGWRAQNAKIVIHVPVHGSVKLSDKIQQLMENGD